MFEQRATQQPLRLTESKDVGLVQIAAFSDTEAELERLVRPVLQATLPEPGGYLKRVGQLRLLRTAARQVWILSSRKDNPHARLQECVSPHIGAVTQLSHSRTCFCIEGPAAREVLAKGLPLDFHPEAFPVGRFALTGLHHTPVLLCHEAENRYDLYAMRTFARWVSEWLADAALPFVTQKPQSR